MKKYTEDLRTNLLKLPVPTLEETLEKVPSWVHPLISEEMAVDLNEKLATFAKGNGPILQKQLESYADDKTGSWLADFWVASYLGSRDPLQTHSNFAATIDTGEIQKKYQEPAELLANLSLSLGRLYGSFVNGTFPLEQDRKGNYQDMSEYFNFFRSSRIPENVQDKFYRADASLENVGIVINVAQRFYQVFVTDATGKFYGKETLTTAFKEILRQQESGQVDMGAFTGLPREQAAVVYRSLAADEINQKSFTAIDNALAVITFVPNRGETSLSEDIRDTLFAEGGRYFSKTFQIYMDEKLRLGVNFEHTAVDGVPGLNLVTLIQKDLLAPEKMAFPATTSEATHSEVLTWHLTELQETMLTEAARFCKDEADTYIVTAEHFTDFGKNEMKTFKASPDAFFHLALAVAQYRQFGRLRSVYEPVAMRAYYQGRTECARSISDEKLAFVKAFADETETRENLQELAKTALAAHSARLAICQKGLGVERHLLGLEKMAEANQVPAGDFLQHPALQEVRHDFISTSGIPYEAITSFSYGPVVQEGFGLYYGVLPDKVIYNISARKVNEAHAKVLSDGIATAMRDLAGLLGA